MDKLKLAIYVWMSSALICEEQPQCIGCDAPFTLRHILLECASCLCVTCFNKSDGVYEINCRAYTKCVEGYEEVVNCQEGEAFNTETKICQDKWKVPPPCGTFRDCTDKSNGFYPDMETHCKSYYTCNDGYFFGHTLCPADLVYNKEQHVCDFDFNTPPPCGTNTTGLI